MSLTVHQCGVRYCSPSSFDCCSPHKSPDRHRPCQLKLPNTCKCCLHTLIPTATGTQTRHARLEPSGHVESQHYHYSISNNTSNITVSTANMGDALEHLSNRTKLEWTSRLNTEYQPKRNYRRTSIICTIGAPAFIRTSTTRLTMLVLQDQRQTLQRRLPCFAKVRVACQLKSPKTNSQSISWSQCGPHELFSWLI